MSARVVALGQPKDFFQRLFGLLRLQQIVRYWWEKRLWDDPIGGHSDLPTYFIPIHFLRGEVAKAARIGEIRGCLRAWRGRPPRVIPRNMRFHLPEVETERVLGLLCNSVHRGDGLVEMFSARGELLCLVCNEDWYERLVTNFPAEAPGDRVRDPNTIA